jgi:dihydropyrimidine dehydrogenase (NAD+) subunit PreT
VFERRPKAGGLNEYGIASYKATGGFARKWNWLLQIGGITLKTGVELGRDVTLDQLRPIMTRSSWASALQGVNALRAAGEETWTASATPSISSPNCASRPICRRAGRAATWW